MAILEGQILTPDKKFLLADELKKELDSLNKVIALGGVTAGQKKAVESSKIAVQKILNNILGKKGVVTPELRGKIDWCTDFDCVDDKLIKKRMAPDAKTFEGYIEGISSQPAAIH